MNTSLTYPYRKSTNHLPRRTFLVNVTVTFVNNSERQHLAYEVTSPDALDAENRVRRVLNDNQNVERFEFTLMRETTTVYNGETKRYDAPLVTVPEMFVGRLVVMHR